MKGTPPPENTNRLLRQLTPIGIWALSFGCSVGWGAFVMPGTTFLPLAGPLGTALGIAAGAVLMLIIGVNYHYLMNRYPDAGGTYIYAAKIFGYDHGFLASWFMVLVYLAIIWANAMAFPLIFRCLFGDLLRFGFHYVIAGYDIYLGEILVSLSVVLIFVLLCLRGAKTTAWVQILMAVILLAGAVAAFCCVFIPGEAYAEPDLEPLFSPWNSPLAGTLFIGFLAPWAFAGFESVSHSVEEYRFSPRKSLSIMTVGLITSAMVYIMLALIASAHQPEGFPGWTQYIRDLGGQTGLRSIPTFYSVFTAIGKPGLVILGFAAGAGIITGLVGNATAASRLIYSMARDELLPSPMAKLNRQGAPTNAILFLALISVPIPFLGRSAIGWIIDVNTIGVTIAYAYTSGAALKEALRQRSRGMVVFGGLGVLVSAFFLFYFLIPNISSVSSLSTESYLILLSWGMLGFVVFYFLFNRDRERRLGKRTAVWIVLLLLIVFASMIWVLGSTRESTEITVSELRDAYVRERQERGEDPTQQEIAAYADGLRRQFSQVTGIVIRNTVIQHLMLLLSILIIFHIYRTVQKQGQTAAEDKTIAEQSSMAKSTFLSNMSHDIRTPMNAIIGYVTLAKREKDIPPQVTGYLSKIESSSEHLLALINDVLEISRIESGRMELAPVPTDVKDMMREVYDLFSSQMAEKGLTYRVDCLDIEDPVVMCDRNRMNRVLLNLVSNAYKFTPAGGSVTVTLRQHGRSGDLADFTVSVEDTGIGMSPEFAARVFEAYEREKTAEVENIQGTGLGTAITKSIVELMGGDIQVFSEQGKGSKFVVHAAFPCVPQAEDGLSEDERESDQALRGLRLLLVEDDPDNLAVEKTLLEKAGFLVDTAGNGEDGVECIAASRPGEYAAVLMDIEMPVKNGYEAARLIRSLRNPALASIPIVAVTARAFGEDMNAAREAGMDGHIAKPINITAAMETLSRVIIRKEKQQ